jgi:hypothetical protein
MSDEIDDFIRRAAERRRQQGQRRTQRPQQGQGQGKPAAQRPRPPRPSVTDAEIVSAEVVEETSRPESRPLTRQDFDQRAAKLGEETAQADDRLEARLHQTFDHEIGTLHHAGTPQATDTASKVTPTFAHEMLISLVSALRSPQQVRQAIILGDILQRPEHRW